MVISNISSPSCHSASPTAPQDEVPEMELDKFSPFGSPEMGDSEISTPGLQGRNADGQGGKGRGLQLPPLKNSLNSHCFRVQLYQIEFQCEPGPRFPKFPPFYPALQHRLLSNTTFVLEWLLGCVRCSELQVLGWVWGTMRVRMRAGRGFGGCPVSSFPPGNCAIPWAER